MSRKNGEEERFRSDLGGRVVSTWSLVNVGAKEEDDFLEELWQGVGLQGQFEFNEMCVSSSQCTCSGVLG